ncbi:MAG: NYN domain-containing protein [Betaproteobacteria bacterium]|jgi:uncharacterized LabA/DUF88 family protein
MFDETLIFVDGENLVFRYQEMLAAGRIPHTDTVHIPDCFVWNPRVLNDHMWNLKRISYHTSVIGDDQRVREVRNRIAATTFACKTGVVGGSAGAFTTRSGQLVPFVRKKSARARKESVCDVALTVEVLRACYRDHAKIIWLFSGDSDFVPLLNEVVHSGKTAYVSALSSGLSDDLPLAVDEYLPLDKYFFQPLSDATREPPSADA